MWCIARRNSFCFSFVFSPRHRDTPTARHGLGCEALLSMPPAAGGDYLWMADVLWQPQGVQTVDNAHVRATPGGQWM
jgi:hypothetical protein